MYFFLAIVGIPLAAAIVNLFMTGIPRSLTHRDPVASGFATRNQSATAPTR